MAGPSINFFANGAGETAANTLRTNLPALIQSTAAGAEAAAAPVAAAVPEAPGFLSALGNALKPGTSAFLPSMPSIGTIASKIGTGAKVLGKASAYAIPAGMAYDAIHGAVDPASAATQPAFQENAKWKGRMFDNAAQGNYLSAAGDAAAMVGSTAGNLALQQLPYYKDMYNGVGKTTAPSTAAAAEPVSLVDQMKQMQADAEKKQLANSVKLSELPQLTIGQMKALQPFLTAKPSPTDNLKGAYTSMLSKQYEQALKEAGDDKKKINELNKWMLSGIASTWSAPAIQQQAIQDPF